MPFLTLETRFKSWGKLQSRFCLADSARIYSAVSRIIWPHLSSLAWWQ